MESPQNIHVYAVVVTFNRLYTLQQTIAALQAQSFSLFKIIVVNNDSSDGTTERLSQQPTLTVLHQENLGGSGGFHTGSKYAYEAGADWVWTMDDDVAPDKNCLETLFNYSSISECLHPIHFYADGEMQEEERWFNPVNCECINYLNSSYKGGKKLWYRNTASFEGMLIKREIISKIGFPDKRFFIYQDDIIYGYLANKYTNVSVVAEAIMRKLPVKINASSSYAFLYYSYRNLWLLKEYAAKEVPGLSGYRSRRIFLQFFYAVYKIFKFREYPGKVKALSTLVKAYIAYRKKKEGKTYP